MHLIFIDWIEISSNVQLLSLNKLQSPVFVLCFKNGIIGFV